MLSHRTKKFLAGLSAVALLALSACGSDDNTNRNTPSGQVTAETPGPAGTESAPAQSETPVHTETTRNAQRAVVTAAKHVDGIAYSIDRDDNGWEVDVLKGNRKVEVRINAAGTKVRSTENDDTMSQRERRDLKNARVSLEDAIAIASSRMGGNLDEAEFEDDRSQSMWSVTMEVEGVDIEVLLDATNGELLKEKRD